MAIKYLNYRHGHLHELWSTISSVGSKCRDWPGEDICAEARAANGAKREARFPEAAKEQGGNKQTDRNTPGLADSAMGQRMD